MYWTVEVDQEMQDGTVWRRCLPRAYERESDAWCAGMQAARCGDVRRVMIVRHAEEGATDADHGGR